MSRQPRLVGRDRLRSPIKSDVPFGPRRVWRDPALLRACAKKLCPVLRLPIKEYIDFQKVIDVGLLLSEEYIVFPGWNCEC